MVSSATLTPQTTVVANLTQCYDDPTKMAVLANLTRSADFLSLKAGCVVGDCHADRLPSVHEAQWLQAEQDSSVKMIQ